MKCEYSIPAIYAAYRPVRVKKYLVNITYEVILGRKPDGPVLQVWIVRTIRRIPKRFLRLRMFPADIMIQQILCRDVSCLVGTCNTITEKSTKTRSQTCRLSMVHKRPSWRDWGTQHWKNFFSKSSSVMTTLYRLGRKSWAASSGDALMVSKTFRPILVETRFASIIGYF